MPDRRASRRRSAQPHDRMAIVLTVPLPQTVVLSTRPSVRAGPRVAGRRHGCQNPAPGRKGAHTAPPSCLPGSVEAIGKVRQISLPCHTGWSEQTAQGHQAVT